MRLTVPFGTAGLNLSSNLGETLTNVFEHFSSLAASFLSGTPTRAWQTGRVFDSAAVRSVDKRPPLPCTAEQPYVLQEARAGPWACETSLTKACGVPG